MTEEMAGRPARKRQDRPRLASIAVTRDHVFACLLMCLAFGAGLYAYLTLDMGTPSEMGPGFFPMVLSVVLAILALLIGILQPAGQAEPIVFVPLRRFVPVILAPIIFGLAIRPLGLVLTMFLTVFEVSFASRFARLQNALLLAAGFTLFCALVFHYLLGLPIPLGGNLFEG